MTKENNQSLEERESVISETITELTASLSSFTRREQNLILVGVLGNILKERRNLIQTKKDEVEEIDKEFEELRTLVVNVNSSIIQLERNK